MRRIVEGLRRFGGPELEPFILHLTHGARPRSVDAPLPTITGANRGELGVAEPFLVPFYTERPEERHARTRSLDEPLPTTTATGGGKMGLIEPFLVPYYGQKDGAPRVSDIDEPVPTIPTENRFGLVEPFVVELSGTGDDNLPRSARIATDGAISLIEPFLSQYYGTSGPTPVSNPVPTVTTRDRFALVEPIVIDGKTLDIRFRMLKPHELSAAMGFPPTTSSPARRPTT
jgi:DNA (cytosine-5)-methyltransferase 1